MSQVTWLRTKEQTATGLKKPHRRHGLFQLSQTNILQRFTPSIRSITLGVLAETVDEAEFLPKIFDFEHSFWSKLDGFPFLYVYQKPYLGGGFRARPCLSLGR